MFYGAYDNYYLLCTIKVFYLANIMQSFKLLIFFSKSQKKRLRILTGTGTGTHYKYRLFNIDSAISYALATFKAHLTTTLVPNFSSPYPLHIHYIYRTSFLSTL